MIWEPFYALMMTLTWPDITFLGYIFGFVVAFFHILLQAHEELTLLEMIGACFLVPLFWPLWGVGVILKHWLDPYRR